MELKAGYKHTDVGIIPEQWEVQALINCCDYADYRGKTPPKTSSGTFLITARNVRKGFIDYDESKEYVATDQYDTIMRRGRPQIGDVLITTEAPLGNVAQIDREDVALAQRIIKYRPKSSDLYSSYLKFYLLSDKFQAILNSRASGSTAKGIKGRVLHQLPVVIPPPEEQSAIVSILSDVDALIAALDQLIVKKWEVKQGVMQQLLTGQRRLPGFQGEWKSTTLGEIGECFIGLTYTPEDVAENGLLVLRASNVQQSRITYDNNVFVDRQVPEHLITRPGDILICVRNGSRALIGKCARIEDDSAGMTFGAFMSVYRSPHSAFVFQVFQSQCIQKQIQENIGATINQITNKDLRAFRVRLPPTDEQTGIATVLSDMDSEITAIERRCDKMRALKQGMMHELLTGRTRLV